VSWQFEGGLPIQRFCRLDVYSSISSEVAAATKTRNFSRGDSYMQLVIYDLVGALFAPLDPGPISRRTDHLSTHISGAIRDSFTDPDFGPAEAAAKLGI
jgi:hypothetical protein